MKTSIQALVTTVALFGSSASAVKKNYTQHATWVTDPDICGRFDVRPAYTDPSHNSDASVHVGWIDVDDSKDSKQKAFFWHFEADFEADKAPLVLVLGGEASVPGTEYVFGPTGPCALDDNEAVANFNRYSTNANLLYVDYGGLGLSYNDGDDMKDLAMEEYLFRFLTRFIKAFPQYRQRPVGIQAFDRGAYGAVRLAEKILDLEDSSNSLPNLDALFLISPHLEPSLEVGYAIQYAQVNIYNNYMDDPNFDVKAVYDRWWNDYLGYCLGTTKEQDKYGCPNVVDEYEHLFQMVTAGLGLDEKFQPNVDPFDVRYGRQERALPYVYHRQVRNDALAKWLNSNETQELLGLKGFAKAGHEYKSFNEEALQYARESQHLLAGCSNSLETVMKKGLRTFVLGGDTDLATSWVAYDTIFSTAWWPGLESYEEAKTQRFVSPVAFTPEDSAALVRKNETLAIKSVHNFMIGTVVGQGHDIELTNPVLSRDLFTIFFSQIGQPWTTLPKRVGLYFNEDYEVPEIKRNKKKEKELEKDEDDYDQERVFDIPENRKDYNENKNIAKAIDID